MKIVNELIGSAIALGLMLALLTGCSGTESSNSLQNRQNEELARQAVQSVGMPAIVNFQEKRILKQIYELRDQEIATVSYIVDFNGKLHKFCDSIGYGLPMSAQYSNPEVYHINGATLPQAEPNGLFMPDGLSATWVLCKDPNSDKVSPVYVEPQLVVSPFPLEG
jgi:hypothetical protein